MAGSFITLARSSPAIPPGARSALMTVRRSWLKRWICEGPAPKPISATTRNGTVKPPDVGTGRFWMVARLCRLFSSSATRIGIWRSDSENLATFWSMSPRVAMRIVWLSAWVVTPSSAARSKRGLIVISGRGRSPSIRGERRLGSFFMPSTMASEAAASLAGSSPEIMTETSRLLPPPPCCDSNEMRASAMRLSRGATSRSKM